MSQTPPVINFDPVTRAPQYVEVVVTANSVDQVTGQNTGTVDTSTPLTITPINPTSPPAVNVTELIPPNADGSRTLRFTPGVLAVGANTQPWTVRISASGRTGNVTFTGNTPPPADVSGVAWNGVGPQSTQP